MCDSAAVSHTCDGWRVAQGKYRKKALKAMKTGKDAPPKPPAIVLPPQHLPEPSGPVRERIAKQPPGTTQAYLMEVRATPPRRSAPPRLSAPRAERVCLCIGVCM